MERFEVVGTFDSRMCDYCGEMNGKVFPMKDFKAGETAPPFHPWCRCTTAPYFEDMKDIGERWARDLETGKGYYVPSDMTYNEWKAKYVDNSTESGIIKTDKISGDKLPSYTSRGIPLPDNIQAYIKELDDKGYIEASAGSFKASDLAILSRETNREYAAFTIGEKSVLIRGEETTTTISKDLLHEIEQKHGIWDLHSHPFANDVIPSIEDLEMLARLPWQETSKIVDEQNNICIFNTRGIIEIISDSDKQTTRKLEEYYNDIFGR